VGSGDLRDANFDLPWPGIALYILLWPEDGKMRKEDILGVFDGTIFGKIARQRATARG
jgi:hypothetical protein